MLLIDIEVYRLDALSVIFGKKPIFARIFPPSFSLPITKATKLSLIVAAKE